MDEVLRDALESDPFKARAAPEVVTPPAPEIRA